MAGAGYLEVDPEEVARQVAQGTDAVVLDVRTPKEYAARHIPGALLVPLQELQRRYPELDPSARYIVLCEHGIRSMMACRFLAHAGFESVCNMVGGMARYSGPTEAGL